MGPDEEVQIGEAAGHGTIEWAEPVHHVTSNEELMLFLENAFNNNTHSHLESLGVNVKGGFNPASALAAAQAICKLLGPVCAAIGQPVS